MPTPQDTPCQRPTCPVPCGAGQQVTGMPRAGGVRGGHSPAGPPARAEVLQPPRPPAHAESGAPHCSWVVSCPDGAEPSSEALGKPPCRMVCAGDLAPAGPPQAHATTAHPLSSPALQCGPGDHSDPALDLVLLSSPVPRRRGLWSPPEISPAELLFNMLFLPPYLPLILRWRGGGSPPSSVGGA